MKSITALWLFWLGAALLCAGLYRYETQLRDTALPLPEPLHSLEIIRADTRLSFQAQNDWQHQGQTAPKLAAWLEQLRHGCPQSYPATATKLPPEEAAITLRFNGGDDWTFGAYNPFSRSHYLQHQDRVYLCHEQLKPRLSLPLSYWLDQH